MRKKKRLKMTSPVGKAVYPYLFEPNRTFSPHGDYTVNLQLSAEDAREFIAAIKEVRDEHAVATSKDLKKKVNN